jgi:hypothetical protein
VKGDPKDEVIVAGAINDFIDWDLVEWTPANVAAFFASGKESWQFACPPECEHTHSHFEELRARALSALDDLRDEDKDAEQRAETIEYIKEVVITICAATAAAVARGVV